MKYWMTTQWPPLEGEDLSEFIWLPDGREEAGGDLSPGDLVLIYQTRAGRTEIRKNVKGETERVTSIPGREGIVAVSRIRERLREDPEIKPTEYANGTEIRWSWYAPADILSRSGFVHRIQVNEVLGYQPSFNLHGFGDKHSGLKRISEQQYYRLATLFRDHNPIRLPPPAPPLPSPACPGFGSGLESEEHRMLKEYVASDPAGYLGECGLRTVGVEYRFVTQDKADLVLEDHAGAIIGAEVEVHVGDNELAGLLQAIKYRYMLELVTKRRPGDSRAFLIANSVVSGIRELCAEYGIEVFVVSKGDVDKWASCRSTAE